MRHGGRMVVEALEAHGVRRVFSVPGESFLAVLDGLCDSPIDNIVCRHEGGAAMMAEATGKLDGTPGVAIVTRGPGATNAASGVHVARHDSTPMILLVGQVPRAHRDRDAFQEIDLAAFFAPLAKWSAEVGQTERLPEYMNRAFHVARSGRPGPVVLSLPEDVLAAASNAPALAPTAPARAAVDPGDVEEVLSRLAAAERPLVVLGGPGWSAEAAADVARFAERQGLPVATVFRRQDYFDNRLPSYAGDIGVGINPALAERLRETDALLLLGTRLGDTATSGYRLLDPAAPGRTLIHVHPDPDLPGRVFRTDLAIAAPAAAMAAALARAPARMDHAGWTRRLRGHYEDWQRPVQSPGNVRLEAVVGWLSDNLAEDAIVTNGAGNYAAWLHRYYRWKRQGTQLGSTSGSMGYGFPAAVAAGLARPGRQVVCLAGDGCFQMTLNEMSTAVQHGVAPVVIVANNGQYGTIRMHQERTYPGRVSGTAMANPDFAALARAYGGHGATVEHGDDFPEAFAEASGSGRPAVIELRLDPEALATGQTLSAARRAGEARTEGSG